MEQSQIGDCAGTSESRWRFHDDGSTPGVGSVFVFGSNTAGRHGKGAALVARQRFGARYGTGAGPAGSSYAIPTKYAAADGQLLTLSLREVAAHVATFLDYARAHPDSKFFVTRVGCGLAGYRDSQVAPLFAQAPDNCSFARQWHAFLGPRVAAVPGRPRPR